MKDFFYTYPYFGGMLLAGILYLPGLFLFRKQIKSIFLSSLIALPQGFARVLLVPDYWNPHNVFVSRFGVEDFLFTFLAGGGAWMVVMPLFRKELISVNLKSLIQRVLFVTGLYLFLIVALYASGLRGMLVFLITMALSCIYFLIYNFRNWPVFVLGAISFLTYYSIGIITGVKFWPELITLWNHNELWGITFFDVPAEEFAWAFLFGGFWSLAMTYFLKLTQKNHLI